MFPKLRKLRKAWKLKKYWPRTRKTENYPQKDED